MELKKRELEILPAYSYVHWWSGGWGDEMEYHVLYTYDPINGSTFEGEGGRFDMDTYEMMAEWEDGDEEE